MQTQVHAGFEPRFRQHSSGKFHATVVPGTNHCGINDVSGDFGFEVNIEFRKDHVTPLDESGFLLDNLCFQQYFDSLPPITVSCEELCEQAGDAFIDMLGERASLVHDVCVRIFPFGDTCVEVDMEAES